MYDYHTITARLQANKIFKPALSLADGPEDGEVTEVRAPATLEDSDDDDDSDDKMKASYILQSRTWQPRWPNFRGRTRWPLSPWLTPESTCCHVRRRLA